MKILSILVFFVWLLTLVRSATNLLVVPRLRKEDRPSRHPLVSVVIPARDEERTIERTVRAMLAQTYPALEVIVVNDRSTDSTGAILASIRDERLIRVEGEEPPPGWLGKPHALHLGARRATGELLLFVDADVIYAPDAISAAVARLEKSDAAMIALLPHFEMRGFWEHVAMPNLPLLVFTMIPIWLANRSRLPLLAIGGGPGNLVRRADYDAIGGHEALKDAVIDDIGLARLFRRGGRRTEVVLANDVVSLRMYHGLREIVEGFTKNAFVTFKRSYLLTIVALVLGFAMHGLPYVLAPEGDPFAIGSVVLIALVRAVVFVPLRYRLDNALLGHVPMMLVWFWIMVRSIWITGVRRKVVWRGRTYDADQTRFGAD